MARGRTRTTTPADDRYDALIQQFTAVSTRARQANTALGDWPKPKVQANIPADVRAAGDSLTDNRGAAVYELQQKDNDKAEKDIQSLEDATVVVETFLKQ